MTGSADAPSCPFCLIVHGSGNHVSEVYRDTSTVAFFPTDPAALGHTLIVPFQHIPDVWSLGDEVAQELTRATLVVATALRQAINPPGLNVIQSNGAAASQTIPHLHVHVVPRWPDDRLGKIWPEGSFFSRSEIEATLASIRRELP